MNRIFRRLPLPAKLMLIGLIPLLFLVFLTISLYAEKRQNVTIIGNYISRIDQSANITRLIDNLQLERQFSFEFVLAKRSQQQMLAQRIKTDSIISRIEASHDSTLRDFTSYSFLGDIEETRNQIDSGQLDAGGVIHFFSATIFRLNTLNRVSPANDPFLKTVSKNMTSQKLLSEMITYFGIINANIYNILYTRSYVVETLVGTLPPYEVFQSYEKEFLLKSSPEVISKFNEIRNQADLKASLEFLNKTFATFSLDSAYTSREWAVISMNAAEQLRKLQMELLQNVEKRINAVYKKESSDQKYTLISLIVALLMVFAIVIYTIHIINLMLNELKAAALKIANGETGVDFHDIPNDVIGSLAHSISKIDISNRILADAAESIGNGNFNVEVNPRSKDDLLGNAIIAMKNNLQKSLGETEASREEFRKLADFVPQLVWTAGADGKVDYFNKNWYEFIGSYNKDHLNDWTVVIHPDDYENSVKEWSESVRTGKPYVVEYRLRNKQQNEYRWFLGRAVPVKNAQGEIIKWFGTSTDIHERKSKSELLESLIKERTEELERSNEDLQQFAHVASHDLKEPLRKIRIFSSRLKEELEGSITPDNYSYLDKIQIAAKRMSAMIEGVLNYSMANNTEQVYEQVNLNELMSEIRQDLELLMQQKNASITFSGLPTVKGIRVLLYQLFFNLLNNSLKFSKEGLTNDISIHSKKIVGPGENGFSHLVPGKEYYSIELKDKGIGFDPAHSERMFQIFARLNSKESYEGTGLGLALCRKIAIRHGGYIIAEGTEDAGATFTVFLPVES